MATMDDYEDSDENESEDSSWVDTDASLATVRPDTPSHPMGGGMDYNHDRFADTVRQNDSMRTLKAAASMPYDLRSLSQGEELGYGEITMFDGEGNPVSVKRIPDPWGVNKPVGGMPDPYVGRPRQ